jgi:light-regulated signal transduction histidine kinase (bacteriophytochrome)
MLEQSNTELENYTYVVSHDLKAPLRTIRSFGAFLVEDYGERIDKTGLDYLERIIKAADDMNKLIEDLLLLSRVGRKSTEDEIVDLNILLEEITFDLKSLIEKRDAEVVINRLPTIPVQRIWIKQLFLNLIDNGLKFNKSEIPRVGVECKVRPKDYLFSVSDNGIGIKEQYFERIFNLFERLNSKDEYEGTGAGLAICKKVAENLGGRIWVESTHGKGSTFFFTMPRKRPDK